MAQGYWIGVDLGGTKILAGAFDDDFRLVARAKQPTNAAAGPQGVFEHIRQLVARVLQDAGAPPEQVRGLGLGIPGQIDPAGRTVRYAPNLDWHNLDLAPWLPAAWSWPCYVENDVKLGTYGEYTHGAAKGARYVLGIFAGTGVGGGIVLNGEIYSGFNFNAGEVGHLIIHWRKGLDLESVAGRHGMMKRAAKLLEDAPKGVRKAWKGVDPAAVKSSALAAYYQQADPIAVELVDDATQALAAAVASCLNFLSPEVIVMGGGVAGALGQPFLDRIWEIAQRYALPHAADNVRFVPAALEDNSGIYGAAAFARMKAGQG
jgi:glucokinase